MNKEKMMQYFADYNSGDYKKAISTHYTQDAVFESPDYRFIGQESIIAFLTESHKGLSEVLRVLNILIDDDKVAAELEGDIQATEDKPNFHIRPLKEGDSFLLKMSAFYDIKDGKISHIRIYRFMKARKETDFMGQ